MSFAFRHRGWHAAAERRHHGLAHRQSERYANSLSLSFALCSACSLLIYQVGRKRLKTALSSLEDLIGVTDFPAVFGKPGTAVTWERFCDVLVAVATGAAANGGGGGAIQQLRAVLQRIVETK